MSEPRTTGFLVDRGYCSDYHHIPILFSRSNLSEYFKDSRNVKKLKDPSKYIVWESKWGTINRASQGRCALTLISLPSTCSPEVPAVKAYTSQRCCLPQWVTQNSTWHQFLCGRHKCPNSKHIFSWQKPRTGVGNGFSTPWVRRPKLWLGTSLASGAFFSSRARCCVFLSMESSRKVKILSPEPFSDP